MKPAGNRLVRDVDVSGCVAKLSFQDPAERGILETAQGYRLGTRRGHRSRDRFEGFVEREFSSVGRTAPWAWEDGERTFQGKEGVSLSVRAFEFGRRADESRECQKGNGVS